MDILQRDILKVLAYFDMFHYPLTDSEIIQFLPGDARFAPVRGALVRLVEDQRIFLVGKFYSLNEDPEIAKNRVNGNKRANRELVTAYRISRFLFKFPFVRGVSISGSLSKDFSDEKSDIDYFIITTTGKLWIARTLLHLFKKLTFLVGTEHHYCMNYFVDEAALEIEEKNLFTAIETVTLLPLCGDGSQESFFDSNKWVYNFLPNCTFLPDGFYYADSGLRLKRTLENIMNNPVGVKADNILLKITSKRWQKKEKQHRLNMKGNRLGLICNKHCCKPNPVYFQNTILNKYHQKVAQLELGKAIELSGRG